MPDLERTLCLFESSRGERRGGEKEAGRERERLGGQERRSRRQRQGDREIDRERHAATLLWAELSLPREHGLKL